MQINCYLQSILSFQTKGAIGMRLPLSAVCKSVK